ncbi:MAG: hypothetical protein GY768_07595 [Planctomycetaceae bacterium]|nr:hypothetical protein [Planctomycetaceae bacterium]
MNHEGRIIRFLVVAWALPYSLIGVLIGVGGLASGGVGQMRDGVLEFHGPLIAWLLDRLPLEGAQAMTLGHTVIARHQDALDITRAHERIHVRQFERWGFLMGPAYLACAVALWLQGHDPYRDNPFERDAYDNS